MAKGARLIEVLTYAQIMHAAVEAQHTATNMKGTIDEIFYELKIEGIKAYTTSHSFYENAAYFVALERFEDDTMDFYDVVEEVCKAPL